MLSIIYNFIIAVITLILLIGIHEYGHYIAARAFSVPVEKFIISPLGGYIKFKSDFNFCDINIYKRFFIFLAGPIFNLLLAFVAYWIIFFIGISQPVPIIGQVLPHSIAEQSGLKPEEKIIAINNIPTETWGAVIFKLLPYLGEHKKNIIIQTQNIKSNLIKNNNIILNNFKLAKLKPNILLSLGITPAKNNILLLRKYKILPAAEKSFSEINFYLGANIIIIKKMLTGEISIRSLIGPIGLLATSFYAAKQGWVLYLAFVGFLSIGLAFANLLPLPGLDGGNIFYLCIEFFRGRPLSNALQVLLFRLGIILLTVLMIQAIMNDLSRLS